MFTPRNTSPSNKENDETMNKKTCFSLVIAGALFFFAAAINAGTSVPDVIKMKSDGYKKHTYNIVEFTHKKHVDQYKASCGECHHDQNGKPLENLKTGDHVQKCIECHKIPSRKPKAKKGAPKLSDKERREYHAEALHDNCKECHKDFNKKVQKKTGKKGGAPVSCNKCHPGGKKK